MFVDGAIRRHILTVIPGVPEEETSAALTLVRKRIERKFLHRRVRRYAAATIACLLVISWYGRVGPGLQGVTFPVPNRSVAPADRNSAIDKRSEELPARSPANRASLEPARSHPASSTADLKNPPSPARKAVGHASTGRVSEPPPVSRGSLWRSRAQRYQNGTIQMGTSSGCPKDADVCAATDPYAVFKVRAQDRAFFVDVKDASRSDVTFTVVQWTGTWNSPESDAKSTGRFCGGKSPHIRVLPGTQTVSVRIHHRGCSDDVSEIPVEDPESSPEGGVVKMSIRSRVAKRR